MKGEALLFMLFSWGLVMSLVTFCFSKLFSNQKQGTRRRHKKVKTG